MTASTCLIRRQLINGAAVPGLRASCLAQCTSLAVRAPAAEIIEERYRAGNVCIL